MDLWTVITTFVITLKFSDSFLLNSDDDITGRCVWYGECGPGFNPGTHLNCPATNTTRDGPVMKDSRGLAILKRLCPNIYKGDASTRTCCSESQLINLDANMALAEQMFSRCPSCLQNFLNLFCQINCGLNQADFMWPDMGSPYPPGYHFTPKGIPAVTILLSTKYAEGFYNSCKDVRMPSAPDKAISMFCGRSAKDCNISLLLNYIGDTRNGQAPFPTKYFVQDHNMTMPDGTTLTPLSGENRPCNAMVNSSETCRVCSCQDCAASCCPGAHIDVHFRPQNESFHSTFRRSQFVISRLGNHSKVTHQLPPPSVGVVNFMSIFELMFMHQVLNFQTNITNIPATYKGSSLTLKDICLKPSSSGSGLCAVESVFQYWQDSSANLDKVAWDEYHFFKMADYLDHFMSCIKYPYGFTDFTKLNMSCRADYGAAMKPMNILNGFDGENYQNSTEFVISFYINTMDDEHRARAEAWDEAVRKFFCTCPTTGMAVDYWP